RSLPRLAGKRASHLIETGGVPWLGDEADIRENRIGRDLRKDGRIGVDRAVGLASEDRCEVEAEAVDVHLLNPPSEAVEDQAARGGAAGPDGVSGAGDGLVGVRGVAGADVVGRV